MTNVKAWKRSLGVVPALMLLPGISHANDFMFSEAAVIVVGPALLAWLLVGCILIFIFKRRQLNFLGAAGLIVFVVCTFVITGHPELALDFWMIYIALLTVYYLFPRASVPPPVRRINLLFHGPFLVLILVGGIIAKHFYWSQMGGFSSWSAWMREIFPAFLFFFGIVFLLVGLRVYFGVVRQKT